MSFRGNGEETTKLADSVASAWEGLFTRAAAVCPVCGGAMAPVADGGQCRDCGTLLA